MPIYNFLCDRCEHKFDALVKADQETRRCPQCGATAHQVPSLPSPFQWGGSGGWH